MSGTLRVGRITSQDVDYARSAIGSRATPAMIARYLKCSEETVQKLEGVRVHCVPVPRAAPVAATTLPPPPVLKLRFKKLTFRPGPPPSVAGPEGRKIGEAVAAQYGLRLDDMIAARTRVRRITWPRQHVMSALLGAGYNPTAVSRLMGSDHSTVLHADVRHRQRQAWVDFIVWCADALHPSSHFERAA